MTPRSLFVSGYCALSRAAIVSSLHLRLPLGHAGFEPPDDFHGRILSVKRKSRVKLHRHPHINVGVRKTEAFRHDANHRKKLAVERHRLPQQARIGAEAVTPDNVIDDGHSFRARVVFARKKRASQRQFDAQRFEKVRGNESAKHPPRLRAPGQVDALRRDG